MSATTINVCPGCARVLGGSRCPYCDRPAEMYVRADVAGRLPLVGQVWHLQHQSHSGHSVHRWYMLMARDEHGGWIAQRIQIIGQHEAFVTSDTRLSADFPSDENWHIVPDGAWQTACEAAEAVIDRVRRSL